MNFCILGAGAWGTAMALHLNRLGHTVSLVPRRFEQALSLASGRENREYLPGFELPLSIQIGHEVRPCLMEAEVAVFACPSYGLRAWAESVKEVLDSSLGLRILVNLSKGMEAETRFLPNQILRRILPDFPIASLFGPTHAREVASGFPTAVVLASDEAGPHLNEVQAAMNGSRFRVYTSEDLHGVELGGCLKNIYAIACGCCDGLGLGDNARAALLTRALAEMIRLGVSLGAERETFYGLSGVGDLVATCHGPWSRNRSFGEEIGRGAKASDLIGGQRTAVEGYRTVKGFHEACRRNHLTAPILDEVYRVLYEGKNPGKALEDLMGRDLKPEKELDPS